MKPCIIVNFFTASIEQEYILKLSLISLNKIGYDIILSSNSPISKEIQSLCTHVIYNQKNRLLSFVDGLENDFEVLPSNYFCSGDKSLEFNYVNFFGRSYILGILDSLNSSYNFAKSMGYTHAHFFVGDIILKENQTEKLKLVEETYKDWNGYFENRENKVGYWGIECLYWFSNIDWFINLFLLKINEPDFIYSLKNCYYLESYLGNIIYSNDNIYVMNFDSDEKISFLDVEINDNLSTTNTTNTFTLLWNKEKNEIDFFILNNMKTSNDYELIISDDEGDVKLFKYSIHDGYFVTDTTNRNYVKNLNVKVIENNKIILDLNFNDYCLKKFKELYEIHSGY